MGQGGAAFGITILTLAYGGARTPDAFALAFTAGAALSMLAVLSALWMGAQRIVLEHTSTASS